MTPYINTASGVVERRRLTRRRFCDAYACVVRWLADGHLPTIEGLMIWYQFVLACSIKVLAAFVVPEPPPYWQGWALVLPSWLWWALLMTATAWQAVGRWTDDCHMRRDGAWCSTFVCAWMIGAMCLRAPGLAMVGSGMLVHQITLAVRWKLFCVEQRSGDEVDTVITETQ